MLLGRQRRRENELLDVIEQGVEAMRLTRDYVGVGLLPDSPGWSHADWTSRARGVLARSGRSKPIDLRSGLLRSQADFAENLRHTRIPT